MTVMGIGAVSREAASVGFVIHLWVDGYHSSARDNLPAVMSLTGHVLTGQERCLGRACSVLLLRPRLIIIPGSHSRQDLPDFR